MLHAVFFMFVRKQVRHVSLQAVVFYNVLLHICLMGPIKISGLLKFRILLRILFS